jgi:aminoglycoside/choline kinase family phosphotransferase
MMTLELAQKFFEEFTQESSTSFYALPQSGSARINFIGETSQEKFIITYNENLLENEAFFYFSEIFEKLQLNTPKIFKINEEQNLYIQEFLGKETLSEVIAKEGESENVIFLVKQTLEKLFNLQKTTQNQIDYSKTFEYEKYDELPIIHDLYYFKNFVADVLELHYHKSSLLKEFKKIAVKIENLQPKSLMIRDFQARNILVKESQVFFIDYQAAMHGPAMYDVVSFLFQAKANFSEEFKNEMLEYYFSFYESEEEKNQLKESLKYCKLIRFLQVLGAYGFRGLIQKKAHFIASIKQGINNLAEFTENESDMNLYPELKNLTLKLNAEETQQKIQKLIELKH